jgi:putative DNA primase/helicase
LDARICQQDLVKKLLPLTGVAGLYGPSGSYKSFLLFDLSLCIALGRPWGGRRVRQADVVYIAAEGAGGFKKRKAGWLKSNEVTSKVPFYLQMVAPNLGGAKHDLQSLIESIEKAKLRPGVICIDTLAQSLGGGDENNTGMAQFVSNATALAIHFQCLIIIVHHVGLLDDERLRGSTNLIGGLDVSIHSARNEGTLSALLKVKKQKDEDSDQMFTAFLKKVEVAQDEDGEPVTTLVVDTVEFGDGETRVVGKENKDAAVLKVLEIFPAASQSTIAQKSGMTRGAVRGSLDRLAKAKLIKKNPLDDSYRITKAGKDALKNVVNQDGMPM